MHRAGNQQAFFIYQYVVSPDCVSAHSWKGIARMPVRTRNHAYFSLEQAGQIFDLMPVPQPAG
jgi:hypothetical protein